MNPDSLLKTLRKIIGSIAWQVFLWGSCLSEKEYLLQIYEQEKRLKQDKPNEKEA